MKDATSSGTDGRRINRSAGWLVALAFALACFPLVYVQMPPVMDYPNHLARLWLLTGGAAHPPLSAIYVVDWSRAATNVAVDWTAAQIGQLVGLPILDRLLRIAMFLGGPLGAALLGRTVFGRFTPWHLAPIAFAWTATTIAGFMSYSISLAAALFAAVLMARALGTFGWRSLALHVLLSALILAIHPFGLLFYLALLSGLVIGPSLPAVASMPAVARIAVRVVVLGALSTIVVLALFLLASHPPSTSVFVMGSLAEHLSPKLVLLTIFSPILSYSIVVDLLLGVPLAAVVIVATLRGWMRVHGGLLLVAIVLALASLVAPDQFGDATWLNRRLPLMAAFTIVAAILPDPPTSRARTALAAVMLVAVIGRIAWITNVWIARDAELADVLAVTEGLRPGQRVAIVRQDVRDEENQPTGRYMVGAPGGYRPVRRHLPALLVPYRHVFIPTLFTISGQQPLRVAPRLAGTAGWTSVPTAAELHDDAPPYLTHVHCDFDYVLLTGADEAPPRPSDMQGWRQVAGRGWTRLYANTYTPRDCTPAPRSN